MDSLDMEELVGRWGDTMYSFCRHLAQNVPDAEDLYQQTFLKAWALRDKIKREGNPKGFLYALAVGIWKNTRRRSLRRERILPVLSPPPGAEEGGVPVSETIPSPGGSAEDDVLKEEQRRALRDAVELLPDPLRIPVLLYYIAGLPLKEIAAALQLPQGTVKSRLSRARAQLKKEMEAMGYDKY